MRIWFDSRFSQRGNPSSCSLIAILIHSGGYGFEPTHHAALIQVRWPASDVSETSWIDAISISPSFVLAPSRVEERPLPFASPLLVPPSSASTETLQLIGEERQKIRPNSRMASQTANNGLDLNAAIIALFQVPDTLYKAWEEHVPQGAQDTLSKASEASGVPKKYLLWIVITLAFYILTGRAGDICYRVVATLYPGYMSFKALESSNKERSTRWLKYWVIHAVIEFVCFFTPSFIDRLASISMMKTIFVLWCILPIKPSGTDIVYGRVLSQYYEPLKNYLENKTHDVSRGDAH